MRNVSIEKIPVNRTLHDFPQIVIIEMIAGCNLECIMCPEKFLTRPRGKMKFSLFQKIVNEIAETAPDTEVWSTIMGEVFLMKLSVFDYVEYAKKMGLQKVYINSNFVEFNPDWIPRLDECGLDKITIGLDGVTKETYDKIRIKGNFEKVEKNIEALLEAKAKGRLKKLEIILQFIVQQENEKEERIFIEKWINKGVTVKIRHRLGWGTAIDAPALCLTNENRNIPCPWLMRTISIHQDGNVAQCDALWDGGQYSGNLNNQTIKEIWMSNGLITRRKRHLANDFNMYPCLKCKDWQCGLSEIYKQESS